MIRCRCLAIVLSWVLIPGSFAQCPPVGAGACPPTVPPFNCWACGCPDPLPGHPNELRAGQAPLLFTQGVAGAVLRDGQIANPDDVWLWVPAVGAIPCCASHQVLLCEPGQLFKLWDSGPTGGPNGNDDDSNELRTLHFDAATRSLLIGYDDAATTGFDAPFDAIPDSALLRMTPTVADATGFITDWTFDVVFDEGTPGTPGVLTDADLWGLAVLDDGTLLWGGGSVTMPNDQGSSTTKESNDVAHTEGLAVASPRHIGAAVFYSGNANGGSVVGQVRGLHAADASGVLLSVSNEFRNGGTQLVLERWDIGRLDPMTGLAEIVYPGELLFETPTAASAEVLDFHVLDTPEDINALICMVGPGTPPALALRPFAAPPAFTPAETLLLAGVEFDGQPAGVHVVDLDTCPHLFTFIPAEFDDNGNLAPVDDLIAGPNRTVLAAQSSDDAIRQYDEFGGFQGLFIAGDAVGNVRALAQSGGFLYTADWDHDDIHRFDAMTGVPAGMDATGLFIPGGQTPPDLDRPEALAVLGNGELLVADLAQHALLRYDATSGALLGPFVSDPLDDITANVRDIDVLSNGDVIVSDTSGDAVKHFDADGVLLGQFSFEAPEGIHRFDDGTTLVASGATFGQGPGLFVVSDSGVILQTLDTSRSYGAVEWIELTGGDGCAVTAECCDHDDNNILDVPCTWCACLAPLCQVLPRVVPADMGGAFGACAIDGFCNIHDRNHALTCFSGTNTCDALNINAGGAFGQCALDAFCNIHDANHALTCFAGTNTCACGPAPEPPSGRGVEVVGRADLRLAAPRHVPAGRTFAVDVELDSAVIALQSYQLHLGVSGGTAGHVVLEDIAVAQNKDHVFAARADAFDAIHVGRGQMLAGVDGRGVAAPAGARLATFTFRASSDAAGIFVIDLLRDAAAGDQTVMISNYNAEIAVDAVRPAIVYVGPVRPRSRAPAR